MELRSCAWSKNSTIHTRGLLGRLVNEVTLGGLLKAAICVFHCGCCAFQFC